MGEVYRARDPRLGRDVAIKVLPSAFAADGDRLRRFEQEAHAAAALNHPILGAIPAGRMGASDEIASAAVYLASDEAAYVTGQTIHVNGGMAMI
jgi:NAD(P)-dependent dehydrogenase (short-subunit alcohol dehydrogenase family)